MSSTRVGVNLLWMVPGDVGGSEEYVTRQLGALLDRTDEFELHLFVTSGFAQAHPSLASRCVVHQVRTSLRRRVVRVAAERTWLRRAVAKAKVDLVHHAGGTLPAAGAHPTVLTMHDVQYTRHPETFGAIKLRFLRWSVPASLKRASHVAVPSRFVAESLEHLVPGVAARTSVVPNAAPRRLAGGLANEDSIRRAL